LSYDDFIGIVINKWLGYKDYGITIDFINYNDKVLASPFDGDRDFDKTIEFL
jgi:hypothetical protein